MLEGKKNFILAATLYVSGLLSLFGFPLAEEFIEFIQNNTEAFLASVGTIIGILRLFTKTPILDTSPVNEDIMRKVLIQLAKEVKK